MAVSILLQSLGKAPGTWSNNDSHLRSFLKFCQQFSLTPWPASPDTLVLYVSYLVTVKSLGVATVKNHLASVRTFHSSHGFFIPSPKEHYPLSLALQGAAKFLSRPSQQKFPVTAPIMSRLLAACSMSSPIRSLYLLLFLTSLRLSSVIPSAHPFTFKAGAHLTWSDVLIKPEGVLVTIKKTKTIICLERTLSFFVPRHRSPSVCLLAHLLALLSVPGYPSAPLAPVFSVFVDRSWVPMTRLNVHYLFVRQLTMMGLNPKLFGWASFRRGSATEYLVATGDVEMLKLHGDWKSSIFRRYLAVPPERRSCVISTLQGLVA